MKVCPHCNGRGWVDDPNEECPDCNGTGQVEDDEQEPARIPGARQQWLTHLVPPMTLGNMRELGHHDGYVI